MELLVPAGNYETFKVAVHSGADAIYIGGKKFGARAFANNFSDEEMIKAIKYAHLYGVKVHVTVNTLINESELSNALEYLKFLYINGVDAVIIQDIGLISAAHNMFPDLEIHASTQMHNSNFNQIKFLESLGVKRVVFARELSIDEIDSIDTSLEKEIFIHGSLCVSYSGQCLFSSFILNRSGNKGECAGLCRLPYEIESNNKKIKTNGKYLLSCKDLNTSSNFDRIKKSTVSSLKIEGRMKSSEYVGCVTKLYRHLLDHDELNSEYLEDLKVIYNREYTKGFINNEDPSNIVNLNNPNHLGVPLGKIVDFNKKYIYVKLDKSLTQGDGIRFNEIDKGMIVNYLYNKKEQLINSASAEEIILLDNKFNIKDKMSLNKTLDIKIKEKYNNPILKKIKISFKVSCKIDKPITLEISDGVNIVTKEYSKVEKSINYPTTREKIIEQLSKLGNTPFSLENIEIEMDENIFINIKDLNEIRRLAVEDLIEQRENIKLNRKVLSFKSKYNNNYDKNINISFLVRNEDQLKTCLNLDIDRIYVDNKILYLKYKTNPRVYLRTSRIGDKVIDNKTLCTDAGALYINKTIGDYFINITNHETINYLSNYSNILTLSVELDY